MTITRGGGFSCDSFFIGGTVKVSSLFFKTYFALGHPCRQCWLAHPHRLSYGLVRAGTIRGKFSRFHKGDSRVQFNESTDGGGLDFAPRGCRAFSFLTREYRRRIYILSTVDMHTVGAQAVRSSRTPQGDNMSKHAQRKQALDPSFDFPLSFLARFAASD
jgi:hypothetical protein